MGPFRGVFVIARLRVVEWNLSVRGRLSISASSIRTSYLRENIDEFMPNLMVIECIQAVHIDAYVGWIGLEISLFGKLNLLLLSHILLLIFLQSWWRWLYLEPNFIDIQCDECSRVISSQWISLNFIRYRLTFNDELSNFLTFSNYGNSFMKHNWIKWMTERETVKIDNEV